MVIDYSDHPNRAGDCRLGIRPLYSPGWHGAFADDQRLRHTGAGVDGGLGDAAFDRLALWADGMAALEEVSKPVAAG